jgi:hypothetical protein
MADGQGRPSPSSAVITPPLVSGGEIIAYLTGRARILTMIDSEAAPVLPPWL